MKKLFSAVAVVALALMVGACSSTNTWFDQQLTDYNRGKIVQTAECVIELTPEPVAAPPVIPAKGHQGQNLTANHVRF